MSYKKILDKLKVTYSIVTTVNLDSYVEIAYDDMQQQLVELLARLHKDTYGSKERLVFTTTTDSYVQDHKVGLVLQNLQLALNHVDISNFFVIIVTNSEHWQEQQDQLKNLSNDPVPVEFIYVPEYDHHKRILEKLPTSKKDQYRYGSLNPIKIDLKDITEKEQFLLTGSKRFCIYPWIHLHAYPTGDVYPCCHAEMREGPAGNARQHTLEQINNSEKMRNLRTDMLIEQKNQWCTRCYEQEEAGFFSGRQSANKHHGHHISRVKQTQPDGTVENFSMTYWDIRFSNLCNLRCRSCGHIFSSKWYNDQAKLAGDDWKKDNTVLIYAGAHETDMWEQLESHIDDVEQIYFAGGEPLLMIEHYNILEELERRGRFDVRLIYNTNFTEVKLKDRLVFDYWRKFDSVAVGASLDAMGRRANYIRKGTIWSDVEQNRKDMMEICPNVDFYVSPTLSIMNAWHITDFHRNWVERGLIQAQDLNVNILQDPDYYRIDIAPKEYKEKLQERWEEHLEWLKPQDELQRATQGFESAIRFMNSTDNTHLIDTFWKKSHQLDDIRSEDITKLLPELEALR